MPDGAAASRPFGNCYWLWPGRLLAGEHPGLTWAAANAQPPAAPHAQPTAQPAEQRIQHGVEQHIQQRLGALRQAGITRFVDLTAPGDPVPDYGGLLDAPGALRLSHPITDFGVPDLQGMRAILDAIADALRHGHGVYLHCRAGIGRTGTVAAVWLVEQGLDAEQALDLLQLKWQAVDKHAVEPHTPETQAQRAFIRAWPCRAS